MSIASAMTDLHAEMRQWRRHLHRFPETAFEEIKTARFISDKLQHFGVEVYLGLGGTGVVGTLSAGKGTGKVALRADMDALYIQEKNEFEHKSRHDGKMHACGHDGHSAMLLGAAKYLAQHRHFDGTVHFIFQPAEEGRAGAKRMIEDGLFEMFPCDYVFGLHNYHDIPAGHFAIKAGPLMASFDCFEITLTGQASHAALPHLGSDMIVAAAQLINALQVVVSRNIDPTDAAVLSITQIHGGHTWNALPESVVLRGTYRCFKSKVQTLIAERIKQTVAAVCAAHGAAGSVAFNPENPGYPITINDADAATKALATAVSVVGDDCVDTAPTPTMGSEDFAFMLQEKPGCYIWLGNGPSEGGCLLHNPYYDFNDDILPVGTAYWIRLVEMLLPPSA
ncbi:MAG: M20 aminoacylase family protein [Gammaproteobacteria bacterium]